MSFYRKVRWPFEPKEVDEILDKIPKQMTVLEITILGEDIVMAREIEVSLEDSKHGEEKDMVLLWLCCVGPKVRRLASQLVLVDSKKFLGPKKLDLKVCDVLGTISCSAYLHSL